MLHMVIQFVMYCCLGLRVTDVTILQYAGDVYRNDLAETHVTKHRDAARKVIEK